MKLMDKMKEFTPLDIFLFIVFVIYIILPVQTPAFLVEPVHSPLGMLAIFIITIFLFLYMNPILAVLFIFAAYELIRTSQMAVFGEAHVPTILNGVNTIGSHSNHPMEATNPMANDPIDTMRKSVNSYRSEEIVLPQNQTLEEDVVNQMAPIGHSDAAMYIHTSYQPVSEPVGAASLY